MNGTQNLNIDSQTLEQCLKSINHLGSTTYQNICTGEMSIVAWGGLDWIFAIFVSGILLFFLLSSYFISNDY